MVIDQAGFDDGVYMKHNVNMKLMVLASAVFSMVGVYGTPVSPSSTVVLVDLHGVLFELSWKRALCTGIKNVFKIMKNIRRLKKEHPKMSFKDRCKESGQVPANCQIPQERVWRMIRTLKRQGYPVYLFSNILPETFDGLRKKFPDLFKLFDGCITPQYSNNLMNKSHDGFFKHAEQLLAKDGHGGKRIYLFDDTPANVAKAHAHRWHGTVVTSPDQCVQVVRRLGFPLA